MPTDDKKIGPLSYLTPLTRYVSLCNSPSRDSFVNEPNCSERRGVRWHHYSHKAKYQDHRTDTVICIICREEANPQDLTVLRQKGVDSINNASKRLGCSDIIAEVGSTIHESCRKKHTDVRKRTGGATPVFHKRSSRGSYNNETDCLFCGHFVNFSPKHNQPNESQKVRTSAFAKTIRDHCRVRNDAWACSVAGRLEFFNWDLHAADCVYHQICSVNFRTDKNIPLDYADNSSTPSKKSRAGRPAEEVQQEAFIKTCNYLEENYDKQLTIGSLLRVMGDFLQDTASDPYCNKHMKNKLLDRYGSDIIFSSDDGKPDVITLREAAENILRRYYEQPKDIDVDAQKFLIIEAAAKIIKYDICPGVECDKTVYPSFRDLDVTKGLSYLPSTLKTFCSKLFVAKASEIKVASIGQCMIQAVRPRAVLVPYQIGLAVQMHHHFRSRYLIDTLNSLGFCSSFNEVLKFERAAASVTGTELPVLMTDSSVIMVADNVDHNTCTIDGRNTLHGMGMIAAITPGSKMNITVPREVISDAVLKKLAHVPIREHRSLRQLACPKFAELQQRSSSFCDLDLLWQISWSIKPYRLNWTGMMQIVYDRQEVHPPVSTVTFLPIIDLSASDMSCILSTLTYLSQLARKNRTPAVITFDQPLFWKASILKCEYEDLKDICLLLGGFHTIMNLLGSIGTLMDGSGLREILEHVYADNAVTHILTGKAYSRAIRGHMLVDTAQSTMLVQETFPNELNGSINQQLSQLTGVYDDVISGELRVSDVSSQKLLAEMATLLLARRADLENISKTSQLWFQYQEMVSTVRKLITSDRIGSFELQLEGLRDCLPIFAAAGHHNYLKSAYLFLQTMLQLKETHPVVYDQFMKGRHVVRRSNRYWAGLPPDIVIEQVLMRSLKTTGGLTRGTGMSETQRAVWLFSMPICSEYNLAMQTLTETLYETSDQHKDTTHSRLVRDRNNVDKLVEKIRDISLYSDEPSLRNIVTGVNANPSANVLELLSVGDAVVDTMKDQNVFNFSLKRSSRVQTLNSAMSVSVKDGVKIDPALLFQRLYVLASSSQIDMEGALRYELCGYPPSLFESPTLLRRADKPSLAKAITSYMSEKSVEKNLSQDQPAIDKYVLDGGSLIQRLPWNKGATYHDIAMSYVGFVVQKYGEATVVFDGYSGGASTKDMTHSRRTSSNSPVVNFSSSMPFTGKKDIFLTNPVNKQQFINLVGDTLKQSGCTVLHAAGDADVLIARTAISMASGNSTCLIGEDTDLLILLLYWATQSDIQHKLLYRSDIKRQKSSKCNTIYDIQDICKSFGEDLCKQLLSLHSFTGCDTTSRIFGISKNMVFHKLIKDRSLSILVDKFISPVQSAFDIEKTGADIMVNLFNGKSGDELSKCRNRILVEKVRSAKSFVKPELLPPTQAATKFHSFRAYLQVCVWTDSSDGLDPLKWGWMLSEFGQYVPVTTDQPPAPQSLLKVVHCNCTTGYATIRCGCRKSGLECTSACGRCQETNCDNTPNIIHQENDESDT